MVNVQRGARVCGDEEGWMSLFGWKLKRAVCDADGFGAECFTALKRDESKNWFLRR